jgi:hypothetical protein
LTRWSGFAPSIGKKKEKEENKKEKKEKRVTLFSCKKIETRYPSARNQPHKPSMTHRYPTRFQAKQATQSKESPALIASVAYARKIIVAATHASCYYCRIVEFTRLMDHLCEDPILLSKGHPRFREITWNKMNETETTLLLKLQEMPARLAANYNKYDMELRSSMFNLLHLMEEVRMKHW